MLETKGLSKVKAVSSDLGKMSQSKAAVSSPQVSPESLESAGRLVDQHMSSDRNYVELSGQLGIASHRKFFGGMCCQVNLASCLF